ncbi:hypothetical protein DT603_13990 [Pseudoxanthomonas gei]|uniref:Uncharacterized protein n=1 Tax=Pseudoxanthomonas gei TaxID=1383030 RepID=A0ABX0AEV9_9GAMM|nr:hypothetical protein [Pseudoxanthomonas gei]
MKLGTAPADLDQVTGNPGSDALEATYPEAVSRSFMIGHQVIAPARRPRYLLHQHNALNVALTKRNRSKNVMCRQ